MFVGVYAFSPLGPPANHIHIPGYKILLASIAPARLPFIIQSDPVLFMGSRDKSGPAINSTPSSHPSGVTVLFWGRLDNRASLHSSLQESQPCPDESLITLAWLRWGEKMMGYLQGDFAFALWDPRQNQLFLARDPLGVKPLYYQMNAHFFAFATSPALFSLLKNNPLTLRQPWLAAYLAGCSQHLQQTPFHKLCKLPAAHQLLINAHGQETLSRWHHWRDDSTVICKEHRDWSEGYKDILQEAVACRLDHQLPVACESSGGLDSSSVIACVARLLPNPSQQLYAFSRVGSDQEHSWIQAIHQYCSIRQWFSSSRKDPSDETIDHHLHVLGYPEEAFISGRFWPFYEECRQRTIASLFSGFGGDQAVSYGASQLPLELLDHHHYHLLWKTMPGSTARRLGHLGKHLLNWAVDKKRHTARVVSSRSWMKHSLLKESTMHEYSIDHLSPGSVDDPKSPRRINDFILHKRLPTVATRLENCTLLAASYGVNYYWPLLDSRLIQYYLATPSVEKMGEGHVGRYLHRRAVQGLIPPSIAWSDSKDLGYKDIFRKLYQENLQIMSQSARQEEAHLHPLLAEMIDRKKLTDQIQQCEQFEDVNKMFYTRKNVYILRQLNRWLNNNSFIIS